MTTIDPTRWVMTAATINLAKPVTNVAAIDLIGQILALAIAGLTESVVNLARIHIIGRVTTVVVVVLTELVVNSALANLIKWTMTATATVAMISLIRSIKAEWIAIAATIWLFRLLMTKRTRAMVMRVATVINAVDTASATTTMISI